MYISRSRLPCSTAADVVALVFVRLSGAPIIREQFAAYSSMEFPGTTDKAGMSKACMAVVGLKKVLV